MSYLERMKAQIRDQQAELARIDAELAGAKTVRRSSQGVPASYAGETIRRLTARREAYMQDIAEQQAEVDDVLAEEASPARCASRKVGRQFVAEARAAAPKREEIAARLDAAGVAFIKAARDMQALGDDTRGAVGQALRVTTTETGDAGARERMRVGGFALGAAQSWYAYTGYAVVLFIAHLLDSIENSQQIATVAGGYQYDLGKDVFDGTVFQRAAKQHADAIDQFLGSLDDALTDPAPIGAQS